jgi:LmbE family N-acetylglucosaminyl deacetylase
MRGRVLRTRLARALEARLLQRCRLVPATEVPRAIVVFAPHPDDETLGCGGTIARHVAGGGEVLVVFAFDGGSSHADLVPVEQLRALRRAEAFEACARLGVPAEGVEYWGLEDGSGPHVLRELRERASDALERSGATEVYVPLERDGHPDHDALSVAVAAAARGAGRPLCVLEYPVWYWRRWPWVPLPSPRALVSRGRRRDAVLQLRAALDGGLGLAAARTFNRAHDVSSVLEQKRAALEAHDTQVQRPPEHARWPVLADVSGGAWLERFFGGYEVFRETEVGGD